MNRRNIKKTKESREKVYAQVGNDELDKILAENWQMWKYGTVRITELQNQDKNWTIERNKKNKEEIKNLYALVGIDELDKIVAETAWQKWKNYTIGITGQRI